MAGIPSQNLQLNSFADNTVRTLADTLERAMLAADAFLTEYNAQNISTLINTDGITNLMGTQDGRFPITGTQIINMKAGVVQFQTACETTLVPGVGTSLKTIIDAIQVNGLTQK